MTLRDGQTSVRSSIFLGAALLLSACGSGAVTADEGSAPSRGPLSAVFSCHSGDAEFPTSACLVGYRSTGDVGGSLRIENDGDVRVYSESDILDDLAASRADITLHEPFSIRVQAGGDPNLVLHLEVLESGDTVYQDEASQFGIMSIDSAQLPRRRIEGGSSSGDLQRRISELNEAVDRQAKELAAQKLRRREPANPVQAVPSDLESRQLIDSFGQR